jgi:hypothetical protein
MTLNLEIFVEIAPVQWALDGSSSAATNAKGSMNNCRSLTMQPAAIYAPAVAAPLGRI